MKISFGKINDGLRDLYTIDTAEMFPKCLLNVIISSLTTFQQEKLFEESFYMNAQDFKKLKNTDSSYHNSAAPIDVSEEYIDCGELGS